MSKLDLIIKALQVSYAHVPGDIADRHHEALSAARSLRELKPVAWQVMVENEAIREFSIKDIANDWVVTELLKGSPHLYLIRPLYALDGVTK
jgi:hypothetical protein